MTIRLRDPDAIHGSERPIKLLTENMVLEMDNPMLMEAHDGAWDRRRRREERRRLKALQSSTDEEASSDQEGSLSSKKWAKSRQTKKFVYRRRKTGIRLSDPTLRYPIQPWKAIRSSLVTLVSIKGSPAKPDDSGYPGTDDFGNGAVENPMHMTIPYGFQLVRQLNHARPTIRHAMYIPAANSSELFVTLDTHYVHIWRGSAKVKKYCVMASGESRISSAKKKEEKANFEREEGLGARAIDKLIYIEKFRLYAVFSTHLHLKVETHLPL
ncbi:hypothetical protein HDU96_007872 [Phlyctochytrium bullatum]|nr:hypothetical protein HDU96_007872 [Phlyctochytrium bullatum]